MYQALYRKYRPQTFDDVVGQRSITETLKNQLITGRLSHAYLFTGTRGTGKTSCAKILAKAVNCENLQDGNPCNCCAACRSIDSGGCMDVLEIDAASNNGVDNVRTLREDAVYTPSEVRRRVYIIDEVHMLSMAAFNALLKIIEEPPEHLVFILATTELHKVPATILSRCQRYSFRRLLPEDIGGRLNYVAYQEGIAIEPEAVSLLARLADGGLRDGLSLLDQCASATAGTLTAEGVYQCLGLAGDRKTAALMEAIARGDTPTALEIFSDLYAGGKDVAAMTGELSSLARDLLILKTAPRSGMSMLSGVCTDQELAGLQELLSAGALLRITNRLQETAAGFARSADRRLDMELCLVELCAPELQMDVQSLNARLSKLEEAVSSGKMVVQAVAAPQQSAPAQPVQPQPMQPQQTPPMQQPQQMPNGGELPVGFWTDLIQTVLPQVQPGHRSFLSRQVKPQLQGDTLLLLADSGFGKQVLDQPAYLQAIRERAAALLGRPVAVKLAVQGPGSVDGADGFGRIADFGRQHPDIFEFK